MTNFRIITSTDEHLSDQPPGFRKDDYRASILRKLLWQTHLAKKSNANLLVRGGDFFHVKAANRTSHSTIQSVASIHRELSIPTLALSGNHDMTNNDISSVMKGQPLGVLYRTGVFTELTDCTYDVGGRRVRLVGVSYDPLLTTDSLRDKTRKRPDDDIVVAVVHALASFAPEEKIQSFFNEPIHDYRDLVFDGCPDAYVFGHYHKDQGVYDHLGIKFVNLGSVSRGALTFENLNRKPKVSMITVTSNGLDVEEIEIPCDDASGVFDLDLKKRLDHEKRDLSDFISKLKTSFTVDSHNEIRTMLTSYPEDLRRTAEEVLEAAEAGVLDE
jgi:DNA repair exonuclease SbcCD nuclease subunit